MSFELTIKADSPDAFAQQLIQAAFLVAPNLSERLAAPKPVAEVAAPAEPEKKPRGRKAAESVAKKEMEATNDAGENEPERGGADPVQPGQSGGSSDAGEPAAVRQAADAAADTKPEESKASEPVSEVEAAPAAMSIDDLRAYTVRQYLNACFDKQDDRRDVFRALCQRFEVEAIGKLPADKIGEFKKVVDEKIAEHEAKKGAK